MQRRVGGLQDAESPHPARRALTVCAFWEHRFEWDQTADDYVCKTCGRTWCKVNQEHDEKDGVTRWEQ